MNMDYHLTNIQQKVIKQMEQSRRLRVKLISKAHFPGTAHIENHAKNKLLIYRRNHCFIFKYIYKM